MKRKAPASKDYNLYIWRFPHTGGCICGRPVRVRGKCIGSFTHYHKLVNEAQRRAVAAGYPASRWDDLYDWNKGARS